MARMLLESAIGRQLAMKSGASTRNRPGPQAPTVRFHDGTADAQTHPLPMLRFGAVEWLEQPLAALRQY
jgi:hypothetical protein